MVESGHGTRSVPDYPSRAAITFGPIPEDRLASAEQRLRALPCGKTITRATDDGGVHLKGA
jgi:hypothetical protein